MSVTVVEAPQIPEAFLDLTKDHLRYLEHDQDELILSYIAAAWAWIDGPAGWLGRSILPQTLELQTDRFDCEDRLPYGPAREIVSITYADRTGGDQTVAPTVYRLHGDRLFLATGQSWPSTAGGPGDVRIRYATGSEVIPPSIQHAVLLMVGQWFRNRMAVSVGNTINELPFGVEALLAPFRKWS